ncbi:hypothetical protein KUTeg_016291 [Tegillarca granosa]|uniref:DEP domain-containing protein n=1 Tax=Tegillarca granosa TaxID=220873 RepID=A0ABQ9EMZ2_TEGGR|nr:hypothetical protein KUTeg_016291 [Tegillarca granosa]
MIRRFSVPVFRAIRWLSKSYVWVTYGINTPAQGVTLFPRIRYNQIRTTFYFTNYSMEVKGQVLVYSILGCPHCMRAKNTLQQLGIPYSDVSLDQYPHIREEVQQRTGRRTVPQVFFNATHVGGNDDLQALVKDKARFDQLLEDVKNNPAPSDAPKIPDPSTAVKDGDPGDFICEPDEYARLVKELRQSGIIKDHRSGILSKKNTFKGKDFVDWVVKTKSLERDRAIEMGQALIDRHFGHNLKSEEKFQDSDVLYRLLDDDESSALNTDTMSDCEPRPAGELGEDIRKLILKIYSVFLSPDGKELQRVQIQNASREEKLAFFINIYNALVIHANVERGPPVNLWQRYKFFNTVRYMIGGQIYSLQDIENGVLRANRKGVGMLFNPFSKDDPRLKVALETHEPLIHFALDVYEQLKSACESFLEGEDGMKIDMSKRKVFVSQIFKWYREDFGNNNTELLHWIRDHAAPGAMKDNLTELLDSKNYSLSFMPYDWGVNSD